MSFIFFRRHRKTLWKRSRHLLIFPEESIRKKKSQRSAFWEVQFKMCFLQFQSCKVICKNGIRYQLKHKRKAPFRKKWRLESKKRNWPKSKAEWLCWLWCFNNEPIDMDASLHHYSYSAVEKSKVTAVDYTNANNGYEALPRSLLYNENGYWKRMESLETENKSEENRKENKIRVLDWREGFIALGLDHLPHFVCGRKQKKYRNPLILLAYILSGGVRTSRTPACIIAHPSSD